MLTAGMTAEKAGDSGEPLSHRFYAIRMNSAKQLANATRVPRLVFVLVLDLVEEGIAQAVGVSVPLPRPLARGERRLPERIGAILAVHRAVEPVAEAQFGPYPP